jgi:hypothetical protein
MRKKKRKKIYVAGLLLLSVRMLVRRYQDLVKGCVE